jgi:hypothetical protein
MVAGIIEKGGLRMAGHGIAPWTEVLINSKKQ